VLGESTLRAQLLPGQSILPGITTGGYHPTRSLTSQFRATPQVQASPEQLQAVAFRGVVVKTQSEFRPPPSLASTGHAWWYARLFCVLKVSRCPNPRDVGGTWGLADRPKAERRALATREGVLERWSATAEASRTEPRWWRRGVDDMSRRFNPSLQPPRSEVKASPRPRARK
jgi:hypothetical protein